MEKSKTKMLAEAGILIAVSCILDYVAQFLPLKLWAQGGSINIALFPIVLYSARNFMHKNGWQFCILVGIASRGLVMLWAPAGIYHPLSAVLDYLLIGALYGLVGLFCKIKNGEILEWGIVVFGTLALCSHILSGVILFSEYMPDVYFGMNMKNMWVYSTLYNATHAVPSMILTISVFSLFPKRLKTDS